MSRGVGVVLALLVTGALLYVLWRWVLRTHYEVVVYAPQLDGGAVQVVVRRSNRLYFGLGKLFGVGGGDARVALTFEHDGRTIRWVGEHRWEPRLLQRRGREVYVVSQGNINSLKGKRSLYFFRWNNGAWSAISAGEFPGELGQMNLWTYKGEPASDPDFRLAEAILRDQLQTAK